MALKCIVDDINSVDEQFRDLYEEVDGKFVLQVDGIEEHPGTRALRGALDRVRGEKRTLSDKLSTIETRIEGLPEDFDAEAYEDLKHRAEENGGGDDTKLQERLERQKTTLEAKHARELETERSKATKLDSQLRRVMVDEGLTKALVEAGISKEYLAASKALLKERGQIKLVEEDGEFHVFADNGIDERTPLTKFVSDWTNTDEGKPFVAKAKGGDATGGNGQSVADNPWDNQGGKVKPNLTKQQDFIKANPEKARQLAKAAGVNPTW